MTCGVQARFLELVPASTLLVGHALQNDLRQLRIVHTRVIDTAVIYPHPKVVPPPSILVNRVPDCPGLLSFKAIIGIKGLACPHVLTAWQIESHELICTQGGTWKSALRFLAERHLKRRIQDGSHDSVIDARTAMDLTLLKIRFGFSLSSS